MQWMTLFKKEMLENWRNSKWIWFPLVIVLLAIMDPITTYYLPKIIEFSGGMPDGATFEMPMPEPPGVIMMSLGQFSSLGVLVIVLISMGTIAGERQSGIAELILVKPVSYQNYITAKWTSLNLLVWVSLLLGLIASWYYTNLLFGDISFLAVLRVVFFYGLWFTFVCTISIFFNTWVNKPGLVAALTIITILCMSIVTSAFGHLLTWSPIHLSTYIHDMLILNEVSTSLIATSIVTIILIYLLLMGSVMVIKKKEPVS